eukprot:m.16033 g.16033  ORF g.16033 m.16033 type:complete len:115 (-) comp10532_c0_seq1:44-388(-)
MYDKRVNEKSILIEDEDHVRHVEKDVVINKMVKEAAFSACSDVVAAFNQCAHGRSISLLWACQDANNALRECMLANTKPEHVEAQTEIFKQKRREYRQKLAEQAKAAEAAEATT